MISYMTRINYKVVISEIIASEGVSKTDASLALTGLFICYGVGQLISGWLGDRIKPRYLMTCGLAVSSLMNVLMIFSSEKWWIVTVWCVNGFGQALMWPPIVRILTDYLTDKDYVSSCVKVSWGGHIGTIAVYLTAPLLIALWSWKSVFVSSAVFGVIGAFVVFFGLRRIEKYAFSYGEKRASGGDSDEKGREVKKSSGIGFLLLIPILFATLLQGAVKDGVDTWMPSFVSENFSLSTKISILSGVILPIFAIICVKIADVIFAKWLKNELLCSGFFFALMTLSSVGLFVITKTGIGGVIAIVLTLLCFTVLSGSTHGVNLMQTAMIPKRYKDTGYVSFISGIINFMVYVGSSLSTYGFAKIADVYGWAGTIILWIAIALLGALTSVGFILPWKKFINK